MIKVAQTVTSICSKKVKLWVHAGALHYRDPTQNLSHSEREVLKCYQNALRQLIDRPASGVSASSSATERAHAPLSFQQEFALTHVGDMFFRSFAVRIVGPLRGEWLNECLGELMQKHDALRTRIVVVDSNLVQTIAVVDRRPLRTFDLCSTVGVSDEEIQRHIGTSIEQWLADGESTFSASLFRINADDHVLLIHWDHLFHDHISCGILFRDLWRLYQSSPHTQPKLLSRPPLQYAEYVAWQRATYAAWFAKHGSYWEHRLTEVSPLHLPTDEEAGQRPRHQAFLDLSFGAKLSGSLHELTRDVGVSLPLIAFSLVALAFCRWCKQKRITIPMGYSGRFRSAHLELVGYLPNFPFVTIEMSDQRVTFIDLFKEVAQQFFSAIQHLDIGVTVGQSISALFEGPLYQWFPSNPLPTHIVLPDSSTADPQNKQPIVTAFEPTWQPPRTWATQFCFPLLIALWDGPTDIRGIAEYREDLFAQKTISAFWHDVTCVAIHVTRNPGACIGSLVTDLTVSNSGKSSFHS